MNSIAPFIGIDFGTSNSKMAWYNPNTNQAEILRNAEGEEQTPSVVYFGESETLVGSPAEAMLEYEQERERIIISIKRELVMTPVIALPGRLVKPVEVVAEILHKLKRDAEEQHFLQEITRVVITCPASFGPLEWDKIREAAQLAGFGEVELLAEPVAAAIAYTQMGLKVGKYVLVYDLGGGTFDLAVLAREDDGLFHPALEPQGIKRCGGDDFDEALYNYCDQIAREKLGRPISLTGKRDLHFLSECRQRKENLSSTERRLFKSLLEPGAVLFQHEIDRVTFESLISPTIEETVRKTLVLLGRANAEGYGVDTIVLVEGSTRVPLAQRLLNESLPLKARPWQHRDVAVAFGGAYHAYSLWKPENQYRKAVALAWTDKRLDEIKIAHLTTLANDLGLTEHQVTDLERAIIGGAKETIVACQRALEQYREAVVEAWVSKKLEKPKIEQLTTLANKLGLNEDQAADTEREVMGETKEAHFAHQVALVQYRKAVEAAWADKKLDKTKIEDLVTLVNRLGLDESLVTDIEREVMGETKEAIFARQVALEQYRKAIQKAWIDRKLSETKIEQLSALANKLDLSEDQVAAIEREIMGEVKDAVFAHQRVLKQYHKAVEEAWADKKLDRQKIAQLYALGDRLNLSDNQVDTIEREVMGEIKEAHFARQTALGQYREAVVETWVSKKLEKPKIERLTALAKELALSKEQVAQIEREVMGETKEVFFALYSEPGKPQAAHQTQSASAEIYTPPNQYEEYENSMFGNAVPKVELHNPKGPLKLADMIITIDGKLVPVVDILLGNQLSIYFEHHILLWKHPGVQIGFRSVPGLAKRFFAGVQIFITEAQGPGNISVSRDEVGQIVAVRLQPGQMVEVREHQFLVATSNVDYVFTFMQGPANILFTRTGLFIDQFTARGSEGIVLLHGYGNVFEKMLAPGETLDLEPGAWLWKDPSVQMTITTVQSSQRSGGLLGAIGGLVSGASIILNRLIGPGRIGIQSMTYHPPTPGGVDQKENQ